MVTGMAWTTSLGGDLDEVWRALLDGACGVRHVPSPHSLRTTAAAVVPDADAEPAERQVSLASTTARAAFDDAGVSYGDPSVSVVLGTSFGANLDDPETESLAQWGACAAERIGHPHQPILPVTACSAGSDSLVVGAELIRTGYCDICVCGGVDVVTNAKRLGHSALGTLSPTGLRAFDQDHDGTVLGEGAAFVVLESATRARARSARVHAVLAGAGSANDADGMTTPDPTGDSVVLATRRALSGSGLSTADIAVISAHGTGTPVNDSVEATSLARIFADAGRRPVVFGTKGALGHSLGATGAIEAITLILALRDGVVPPIHGLVNPIAHLPLRVPAGRPLGFSGDAGISLTLGFGGFNTCLLFTRGRP